MIGTMGSKLKRVVIVDDDRAVLNLACQLLRSLGFLPVGSERPFGVLNLIAENDAHVVLLDVRMPGLDGEALFELIRRDARTKKVKILLFSSLKEAELSSLSKRLRADGYVVKTPIIGELEANIRRALLNLI